MLQIAMCLRIVCVAVTTKVTHGSNSVRSSQYFRFHEGFVELVRHGRHWSRPARVCIGGISVSSRNSRRMILEPPPLHFGVFSAGADLFLHR